MEEHTDNLSALGGEPRGRLSQRGHALLGQLKSANAAIHDLAWELEDVERRLQVLVERQAHTTSQALEAEIEALQHQRADLEDQLLHHMLQTDLLAKQVEEERCTGC